MIQYPFDQICLQTAGDCNGMTTWNQEQKKQNLTCLQSKYNPNGGIHQLQHTLKFQLYFTKIPVH